VLAVLLLFCALLGAYHLGRVFGILDGWGPAIVLNKRGVLLLALGAPAWRLVRYLVAVGGAWYTFPNDPIARTMMHRREGLSGLSVSVVIVLPTLALAAVIERYVGAWIFLPTLPACVMLFRYLHRLDCENETAFHKHVGNVGYMKYPRPIETMIW
jgi:hypothetical protein